MMKPFAARPIRYRELLRHDGWRLKCYAISAGDGTIDASADVASNRWPEFEPGRALALSQLPSPAEAEGRDGVGFIVEHRGGGADYLVLGWWDRENELPVRVVVRDQVPGAEWRSARASESFCVWDLQVIAFERDAYVSTMLSGETGVSAAAAYLARTLEVHV